MSNVIKANFGKKQYREPLPKTHKNTDFSDRMSRIKASLEKINSLMAELKEMKEKQCPTKN